jgi:hypothetical protein
MIEIFGLHWNGFSSSVVGKVLGSDTHELWWLTCVQCGSFSMVNGDEVDAHLEKFWFKVPQLEYTDAMTLRPSAISAGAHLMNWDEWAYLLGFSATNEAEATLLAPEFFHLDLPHGIWPYLGNPIELFVHDFAGGDAAVFTSRRDWFDRLRTAYPQSQEITPGAWQQRFNDAERETQEYLEKHHINL